MKSKTNRSFGLSRLLTLASASLFAGAIAGCAVDRAQADDDDVEIATHAVSSRPRGPVSVTEGMRWLSARSERELGEICARGSADAIPLGANSGMPLLPRRLSALEPIAVAVYQGSVWTAEVGADGKPLVGPDGNPVVTLRDKFIRDGQGGLITYFEGRVLRRNVEDVDVGSPPPRGTVPPDALSPFSLPIVTDGKPSLFVDYHADATPFVNRILDEIREVDHARCPGLYLGRAHFLRDRVRGVWTYLYYFALDFGPAGRRCAPGLP